MCISFFSLMYLYISRIDKRCWYLLAANMLNEQSTQFTGLFWDCVIVAWHDIDKQKISTESMKRGSLFSPRLMLASALLWYENT